ALLRPGNPFAAFESVSLAGGDRVNGRRAFSIEAAGKDGGVAVFWFDLFDYSLLKQSFVPAGGKGPAREEIFEGTAAASPPPGGEIGGGAASVRMPVARAGVRTDDAGFPVETFREMAVRMTVLDAGSLAAVGGGLFCPSGPGLERVAEILARAREIGAAGGKGAGAGGGTGAGAGGGSADRAGKETGGGDVVAGTDVGAASRAGAGARARNAFAEAAGKAQARCVKIYGAGIAREHGYATGIVVSPDGFILTVRGIFAVGERILVVTPDGRKYPARIHREDLKLQTLLLKIEAEGLTFFDTKAPTRQPDRGDWIVCVANPFRIADGPEPLSLNVGILSLRAELDARRKTRDFPYDGEVLIVDSIVSNPGSPGGAAVDINGNLIGMIGKIVESVSSGTRLNYIMPVEVLKRFVEDGIRGPAKPGTETAGTAPAAPAPDEAAEGLPPDMPPGRADGPGAPEGSGSGRHAGATKESAETAGPTERGSDEKAPPDPGIRLFRMAGKHAPAYVEKVMPGSPAEAAGLKPDDLIVAIGREGIGSCAEFDKEAARQFKPGKETAITVKRGKEILRLKIAIPEGSP
ncbi:MAG: S1C family serine protease, partial [Planctomycetota bacterium]|nr:S1C family serine protease [Planctomycetota bacterium]